VKGCAQAQVAHERVGTSWPAFAWSEGCHRRRRGGWLGGVLAAFVLAALVISPAAIASQVDLRLAARLAARDPAARVNGSTIVATGAGARIYGGRGRPSFVAALGSGETIIGGKGNDDLAALGDNVTIRGGRGNDLIYGGRGARLISGSGHDLLVARGANATIQITGSKDTVVVYGAHDRVLCSRSSRNDTIYAGKSDSVSRTCRGNHARILSLRQLPTSGGPVVGAPSGDQPQLRHPIRATAAAVTGDGGNGDPFVAPCDDPQNVDCIITAFPARTLSGGWANEYVPAYKCPPDHPYLLDRTYAPPFTTWAQGIEIWEDIWQNPVAVSITGMSRFKDLYAGTATGYPNSSATNWAWGGTHWYRVVMHCSSNRCHGSNAVGPPRGCGLLGDRPPRARSSKRLVSSSSTPGQP
jgi:hypothetical protein